MNTSLLSDRLWPASGNAVLRNAVLAVVGSGLVAAAAHVSVVMLPVPITLQTLAVLAIGATYGSRLGAATLGDTPTSMQRPFVFFEGDDYNLWSRYAV